WQPIKEVTYMLEANDATLADCFIYLIKLAVAIDHLPDINTFKIPAIHIFNHRYEKFLHPLYILAYYIHPQYRGKGLKDNGFHTAALTSLELWQNLGHTRSEEGMAKIRSYYMTNIRHELNLFGKELTEVDLRDACNITSIGNIISCEGDQTRVSEENSLDNTISDCSATLLIKEIIDLTAEENSLETVQIISPADLDYNPYDVLNSFLERESQNQ
ncbi:2766_t:CDS:2, partial [Acaulospora morrowiae]